MLAEQLRAEGEGRGEDEVESNNVPAKLAETIRVQWQPGMSKSAVSRLLGKDYAGTSWCRKVDQIIDYLVSTTPTQEMQGRNLTPGMPKSPLAG